MLNLKEKPAIVTGAGGGLGRTYALELARRVVAESEAAVMENRWIDLGATPTAEEVQAQWERIGDLSAAQQRAMQA